MENIDSILDDMLYEISQQTLVREANMGYFYEVSEPYIVHEIELCIIDSIIQRDKY